MPVLSGAANRLPIHRTIFAPARDEIAWQRSSRSRHGSTGYPLARRHQFDAAGFARWAEVVAVKPDKRDFAAVEREYGPLPATAGNAARAERYRLAQSAKIIRQLKQVVLAAKTRITKKRRRPK